MSLVRLYNKHGVLVYRNAFVSISLTNLPPIISTHTVVRKVFSEREAQIVREGSLLDLLIYRQNVLIFYKTVEFVNGPEIEMIEKSQFGRNNYFASLYGIITSITSPILAIYINNPYILFLPCLYLVYIVVFSERIRREKEMYRKIDSLQFFENTLLEVDYRKFLQEMDLKKE